ncbi:poly(A)-specific ribonuclease PARN isoform X2 [Bemisia tabaci]|uniref:poly(A)-specific ribonuclease PARN isoform X2 n=1 Tax=Bemisia tabaci TaxID=7038 RepID=UPI003B28031D
MEVTKDNFQSLLPDIKKSIDEASFLAIDGEFTGLNDGGPRANPFDTPAQYFDKIRNGCSEFLLIQFGLCVFKYNQSLKRFTHTAYNFYIFPCPINRDVPDFRFRCQSSSLNFLACNNFDFNKLFKSGIPFLTHDAEQELLKDIEEREKQLNSSNLPNRPSETPIKIPDDLKENVDSACNKIQSLIDKGKPGDSIEIEEPNGFARKLIYQAVDNNFSTDPIIMESKKQPNRTISLIVTKGASRQELERIKSMKALEEMKARLKETVGFSAIIRLISESGKLVVGHNMFLDIFYTISQFCTPLQSSYEEFKEITHFTLPKVIDTKVMCSLAPLKEKIRSSVLPHLLETIQTEPFEMQQIAMDKEGCGYALKDVKEHEAGYDAYMTGVCFLALYDHLNSLKKLDALNYSSSYISNAPALKDFINKVYLMRRFDAPYINLGGKDPVLFRRNVFHVDFPKEWATSDLISLFKPYGDVDVVWCNSTSAWVSLYDKSNNTIQKVIKNLVNCTEPKNYTVRTFAQYQDYLESMSTPVTNPSPLMGYRKRKLLEMASPDAGNSAKTPKIEPTTSNASDYIPDVIEKVCHIRATVKKFCPGLFVGVRATFQNFYVYLREMATARTRKAPTT